MMGRFLTQSISRLRTAVAALLLMCGVAQAQVASVSLGYECNVGGTRAELLVGVEFYGRTQPPGGWRATYVWGVIMTPGSRIFYGGQMATSATSYVFTGEANYGEFTDLRTGDRFIVQFAPNNDQLTLIVNPLGPQTTQVNCQLVGVG